MLHKPEVQTRNFQIILLFAESEFLTEMPMCKVHFSIPVLLFLFLFPVLARADSIATIDVSASFIPSQVFFGNGPTLFMTGQFTLDEDTKTIGSWNLGFLGPLGATYQLSAQNGGVATAQCVAIVPCPVAVIPPFNTAPTWIFSFGNGIASTTMYTTFISPVFLFTGESLPLCANQNTFYPSGIDGISFGCGVTSGASFDNMTGFVYQSSDSTTSSGNLTVVSVVQTPEPAESTMLLFGIAIILGVRHFSRIQRRLGIAPSTAA